MAIIDDKFSGESAIVDLDAHVPDTTGTGWTLLEQTGAKDLRIRGDLGDEFLSGEAEDSERTLYTAQGTYPSNEYDVEIDVLVADTGDDRAWLLGRVTDSNNYYAVGFVIGAGGDLELVKKVAGTVTLIDNIDTDWTAPATIKFQIRDATKKVFIDDIEKISTTDNALTSTGEAGLALGNIRQSTNDLGSLWDLDNFLVTAAAAAANPKGPLGMPLRGPFGGPI